MPRSQLALAAVALLMTGCFVPKTPPYEPNTGMGGEYCAKLAQRAQLSSTTEMGGGVTLLLIAGASVAASGALSVINSHQEPPSEILGYTSAGLLGLPLVAVPVGLWLVSRSDGDSALSAAANSALALSDTDEEAFRQCALARAAWDGSLTDAPAPAREAPTEDEKSEEKPDDTEQPPAADPEPAVGADETEESGADAGAPE